jgi:hypothetical protein
MNGGVEDRASSGSFNGDMGATYLHNLITFKTYEIYYTSSHVYFVIDGELLHTFHSTIDAWADTMSHYIYMDNVNSNQASTNNVIDCKVASIQRLGQLITQPMSYYLALGQTAGINLKLGPGNLHSIIINNVTNNAVITVADSTSAATPVIWKHTAGATSTAAYAIDCKGLPFHNGLRLVVATADASVTIIYE